MLESKAQAFLEYALTSNAEAVRRFQKHCETLANHITNVIMLMERHGFEDGKVGLPTNLDGFDEKLDELTERLKKIDNLVGKTNLDYLTELNRLKEFGLLEERLQIKKEIRDMGRPGGYFWQWQKIEGGDSIRTECAQIIMEVTKIEAIEGEFYNDILSQCTWVYLENLYRPFCEYLDNKKLFFNKTGTLPSVTIWRQVRRLVWDASDAVSERVGRGHMSRLRSPRVGNPSDEATRTLVLWAFACSLTTDELARMLVMEGLDRDRSGTPAARIRREKKRLAQYPRNKRSKPQAPPVGI